MQLFLTCSSVHDSSRRVYRFLDLIIIVVVAVVVALLLLPPPHHRPLFLKIEKSLNFVSCQCLNSFAVGRSQRHVLLFLDAIIVLTVVPLLPPLMKKRKRGG